MAGDRLAEPVLAAEPQLLVGRDDLLEQAAARGEIRPDVTPAALLGTLIGPLYVRLLLTDQRIDDEFIRDVINVVLDGAGG